MSREKNCKWYFGPASGRDDGPNDAMAQNFKEDAPWASLVRESIQNSLDAVYDGMKPVKVVFAFKEINRMYFPNFFDLKEHIQGCLDYYPNNQNAKRKFEPMLELFDESHRIDQTISYIKVSDFNTRGMNYDPTTTDSPFYAFVQAAGVTVKEDLASGGSFGFGKAAYFNISPISTILVSTQTIEGHHYFEGVSALCTHKCNDKKYTSVGFYSEKDGEPISVNDDIPVPFRRNEPGTDVLIMGIKPDKNMDIDAMIEATIRNFWLAILEKKLEVVVGDVELNPETLPDLMKQYFPYEHDTTKNYSEHYNPRPYYDTIMNADSDNAHFEVFTEKLPLVGLVRFYVQKNKNADDKIAYFRRQKMLVFKKKNGTNFGCYGVFVCDDQDGNIILKSMEPPAHNKWLPKNSDDPKTAKTAIEEIEDFIKRSLDSCFDLGTSSTLSMTDLEDYLYTEDLSASDDEDVDNFNPFMGHPIEGFLPEGGEMDTNIEAAAESTKQPPTNTGTVILTKPGTPTPGGDTNAGTGHKKPRSKHKGGKPGPGNTFTKTKIDPNNGGAYKTFIDVNYRVVAQKESGIMYHYLIIHSEEEIEKGEINLLVGSESSDVAINIVEADNGRPIIGETKKVTNVITDLVFHAGKNTIKIRFNDNMRHSIILKAYKIKKGEADEN